MPEAARLGDQIGHTSAMAGLLVGALAGVLLAVAVIAVVGTGGVAAVAIGAGIAAAGAGGALSGAYIGELIPTSPTGAILTGSATVVIGGVFYLAARAGIDTAACSGILLSHGIPLIAQGSATVLINGMMAARKGDKLVCGASVSSGCTTVIIGGETATVPGLTIDSDVPTWLTTALWGVMIVGTIIATGGAVLVFGWGPALGGLIGGTAGSLGLGWVGGKIGGWIGGKFGNAELGERIGEVGGGVVGGFFGGWAGSRLGGRIFPGRTASPTDIDTGRQNIHKPGTNEYKTRSSSPKGKPTAWKDPSKADDLTLDAFKKGQVTERFPDGSPKEVKWNAGKPVGENGETQVTVKVKQNGKMHGFPSGKKGP